MAPRHDQRDSEYQFGRRCVPVDVVAVPRRRIADEPTRPLPLAPAQPGPTLDDLARLDAGELAFVRLGRYRLERRLGRGGMSSVYRGTHATLGRAVAVKVLTRDLSEHPDALARFSTEARLSVAVHHRNVVEVLDFATTPGGLAYLVMPLHEGEDLRVLLQQDGPLAWVRARALVVQLCEALDAVHAQGIVHRDVKPSNCLHVVEAGRERVLLADFGVACRVGGASEHALIGTPEYMAPEQARGERVDARSDVYSLGIVLGELLTGRVPFTGKSVSAVLDAQVYEPPPRLAALAGHDGFPPALEAIYAKALAKDPAQRFASARELADALLSVEGVVMHGNRAAAHSEASDATLRGRPFVSAPRRRVLALAAVLALGFGLAAYVGWHDDHARREPWLAAHS